MEYTRQYMRKNRIAIHCKTQKGWDYITEKYNIEWGTIDGYKTRCGWKDYKKQSVIFAYSKSFAGLDYAKDENYTIITFEQFKKGEYTMSEKIKIYGLDKRTGMDSIRVQIAEEYNINSSWEHKPRTIELNATDERYFITCKCQIEYIDHNAYTDKQCSCCCKCSCCCSHKCPCCCRCNCCCFSTITCD